MLNEYLALKGNDKKEFEKTHREELVTEFTDLLMSNIEEASKIYLDVAKNIAIVSISAAFEQKDKHESRLMMRMLKRNPNCSKHELFPKFLDIEISIIKKHLDYAYTSLTGICELLTLSHKSGKNMGNQILECMYKGFIKDSLLSLVKPDIDDRIVDSDKSSVVKVLFYSCIYAQKNLSDSTCIYTVLDWLKITYGSYSIPKELRQLIPPDLQDDISHSSINSEQISNDNPKDHIGTEQPPVYEVTEKNDNEENSPLQLINSMAEDLKNKLKFMFLEFSKKRNDELLVERDIVQRLKQEIAELTEKYNDLNGVNENLRKEVISYQQQITQLKERQSDLQTNHESEVDKLYQSINDRSSQSISQFKNKVSIGLRNYYSDFASVINDEMTIELGEGIRDVTKLLFDFFISEGFSLR